MSRPLALLRLVRRLAPTAAVATVAVGVLGGCEKPREVAVRVSIPGPDSAEAPAAGVGVIALPYDRDSVLHVLAGSAHPPEAATAALDSLFRRFRGPFAAFARATARVDSLQSALAGAGRDSLRLADSLRAAQAASARAGAALDAARRDFVGRSESLRALVRHWEDSTYRGYDSIVGGLARRRGAEPATDTTDATGWAHFRLAPGRWWIYARSWDANDPNAEWYWNVPAVADTVLLSSRSGRLQPRY